MKTVSLVITFIFTALITSFAQDIDGKNNLQVTQTTTTETYQTNEPDWVWNGTSWTSEKKQLNPIPSNYTITTKTVSRSAHEETECRLTVETNTFTYKTDDTRWVWKDGYWLLDGKKTKDFPRTYTKEIKKNQRVFNCEVGASDAEALTTSVTEIQEYYQLNNQNWQWDSRSLQWKFNGMITNPSPVSRTVTQSIV